MRFNRRQPAKKNGARGRRTFATSVLAQGVGAVAKQVFGSDVTMNGSLGLNAIIPKHLPLPRPVAAYTVVRVNKIFSTSDRYIIFGTFHSKRTVVTPVLGTTLEQNVTDTWDNIVCVHSSSDAVPVNDAGTGWSARQMPISTGSNATIVPAAFTVQMMCSESLQNADGIIYGSVMRQQFIPTATGDGREAFVSNAVAVNPPRLCSAGKLALRGVQFDLAPMNMSELASFKAPARITTENAFGLPGGLGADGVIHFAPVDTTTNKEAYFGRTVGFQPAYVYNPNQATLNFVVTVEYRIRFDPTNLAAASHRTYPSAPLSVWEQALSKAEHIGHGLRDIAEVVANVGEMVGPATEGAMKIGKAARTAAVAAGLL